MPTFGSFLGITARLASWDLTSSYKTKGDKKGLKPAKLHAVLSWTERRDGICGLATVLLYSVTTVVQYHL